MNTLKIKIIIISITMIMLAGTAHGGDNKEAEGNASFIEWLLNEKSSDKKSRSVEISDDFIDKNENGIDDRFEKNKKIYMDEVSSPTPQKFIKQLPQENPETQIKNITPQKDMLKTVPEKSKIIINKKTHDAPPSSISSTPKSSSSSQSENSKDKKKIKIK